MARRRKLAPVYYEARGLLALVSLLDAARGHVAQAQTVTRVPLREHHLETAWRYRDDALVRLNGIPVFSGRMRRRCDAQRARIEELTQEIEAASLALVAPAKSNVVNVDFKTRKAVAR